MINMLSKSILSLRNLDSATTRTLLAKIVDGVKVTEEKARKLFDDVKDKQNVEMEKFKQAIATLAAEQKTTVEGYTKILASEGAKFFAAASAAAGAGASAAADAAASAFKEAMNNK